MLKRYGRNLEFKIVLTPRAKKNLEEVDRKTRDRIKEAINGLNRMPPKGDIKKLKGFEDRLRLRVGDWRIVFTCDLKNRKITIVNILPRREAYR